MLAVALVRLGNRLHDQRFELLTTRGALSYDTLVLALVVIKREINNANLAAGFLVDKPWASVMATTPATFAAVVSALSRTISFPRMSPPMSTSIVAPLTTCSLANVIRKFCGHRNTFQPPTLQRNVRGPFSAINEVRLTRFARPRRARPLRGGADGA